MNNSTPNQLEKNQVNQSVRCPECLNDLDLIGYKIYSCPKCGFSCEKSYIIDLVTERNETQ